MSRSVSNVLSRLLFAAAVIFTITAYSSASPASAFSGQWFVEPSSKTGEIQVTLRYERHWDGGNSNSIQSFAISADKAVGLTPAVMDANGAHGQFKLVRDAGSFICDGWFSGGKGSGTYSFEADPKYAAELEKRGIGTPTAEQQFRLAMADTSVQFVDALKSAKYEFDIEDLVRAANHGVTSGYVRDINALGYKPSTLQGLIRMRDHGVTPQYVRALQASGLKDLPEEQVIRLRDHGVTPEYIQQLSQFGITDLPAESLIKLRDHGVTPDFIASIRKSGYKATPEELSRLRDHGVSPEFIAEIKGAGLEASPSDLARLRDHGVSAEFVKEVRGAGLKADVEDFSRLRDHGVTSEFIAQVMKSGFSNITVNDLTRLRDHGVDAGYLKLHGKGRSVDDVIRMHDRGGENDVL
jgi:hypothetical protein